MNPSKPNLTESIRSRLENHAKTSGQNFEEVLYRYAIERFLFRLSHSRYQERFVLKGAQVVTAWGVSLGRPSRDIDLRGYIQNTVEHIEQVFRDICDQPVEPDGLIFDTDSVTGYEISEEAEYAGVRILFMGRLGRARVRMQVDIGFSDTIIPQDIQVQYPTLLGMSPPTLRGYPPEMVIAEKIQAILFLGEINSRMKDFYDIWLLSRRFDFDGEILQKAISTTFYNRNTPLPDSLPFALTDQFASLKQTMWHSGFLGKLQFFPDELIDFQNVISQLRIFVLPPLFSSAHGEVFDKSWGKAISNWVKNGI